ncbi:hypothetical protein BA011_10095 [Rhizobium leguminosarum]|uniref:KAP NTPase domain-containing protein n=2 Tax=Rhizobium leguminosarum TaxID=384 RepID=A0A1B1C8D5_RHILE|nr:hypothetical protein BA011_10095 [Rhizobium leguminosarum]
MWSDNETNVDYLNYSEVAEIICDMVSDKSLLPLSLGVYGGWGSGKSSVLKLVERALRDRSDTIVIEFDAWLYQGFDEAKSALMTVIASELMAQAPDNLKSKAVDLFKRVNKLRVLGLGVEVGMASVGLPTFGIFSKMLNSAQDAYEGNGDEQDLKAIQDGAKAAKEKTGGLLSPREIRTPPEEITAFKNEFSAVLDGMGKRLVVFVDNLDRCLPANAIKCLEATRLFLSMPNAAFIIAADVDMIRHAVSDQFKGASETHVTDYLDKLIQFPVTVPRLGMREVLSFLCMLIATRSGVEENKVEELRTFLVESIQNSWKGEQDLGRDKIIEILSADVGLVAQIDMAFRIAPILARAKSVSGNPRIIKRMMNIIRMRHATAIRRDMQLDEAIITKLALFERCTDEATFKSLLDLINDADQGKPKLFVDQKNASADGKGEVRWPEKWNSHDVFIKDWLAIEPLLDGIDLRPAVYLARETLPLQFKSKSLSSHAKKAIAELLRIPSLTSRAAPKAIATIPPDEISDVMQELVAALRQNSDWSRKRNDLTGAIILAQHSPENAHILAAFLEQIPNRPPWLKASMTGIGE